MVRTLGVGPIGVNAVAYSSDGVGCVLFDPGFDAAAVRALAGNLPVRAIVLTHGHLDHCAALPALLRLVEEEGSPRPPVAIHRADARYLGPTAREANEATFRAIRAPGFFSRFFVEMPEPDIFLEDDDEVPGAPGLRVLHAPGHSPGSCCFHDARNDLLLSGDTLFLGALGRVDCPDSDAAALFRSVRDRLLVLPPSTRVIPGHGPETTIGAEAGLYATE